MSPKMDFDHNFFLKIPSREDWECNRVQNTQDIEIFTVGSKMETGAGAGIYTVVPYKSNNRSDYQMTAVFSKQKSTTHKPLTEG